MVCIDCYPSFSLSPFSSLFLCLPLSLLLQKDAEYEPTMSDAFAYSIVTVSEVRKASSSQIRRRANKGKKGFELRKSRSVEHLCDFSKEDGAVESVRTESPLVSESLNLESHIYATVNKPHKVPPQPCKTPPPLAAKPSPRPPQASKKMVPPGSPALERPAKGPENLAGGNVADEDEKPKEDVGGAQENPQVNRRPVYAVVVKSSEQMDASPEGGSVSQEMVVSDGKEGRTSPSNIKPCVPKGIKTIPARPVSYAAEPKLPPTQPPSHPPPIHTSSSKSASKYAHLMNSAPPSHPAPKPPKHSAPDFSHLKNISLPVHPPPIPPEGPKPKPIRSHSEESGIPISDPIYEALDEDDVSDSIGPLPNLKQKYPVLKPKYKPAPPPPNIKKARSLDAPTSKDGSLVQSLPHVDVTPPHTTPSQV